MKALTRELHGTSFGGIFRRFNLDALLLLALLVVAFLPQLLRVDYPRGDTHQTLFEFVHVYNSFFFSRELPLWLPFGSFGVANDLNLVNYITPSGYLTILVGALLKVRNGFLLYNVSMLLDQLLVLTAAWFLCRRLFRSRVSVFFVCAVLAVNQGYFTVFWNFRIFAMFPVHLLFLVIFFQDRKPEFLWLAGASVPLMMLGNLQYLLPIYLFCSTIFIGYFLLTDRRAFPTLLRPSSANLGSLLFFLIILTGYLYVLAHAPDFKQNLVGGRDAHMRVALPMFLDQGATLNVLFDPLAFLFGFKRQDSASWFIGLTPIVFFSIALLKVRGNRFFFIFGILTLALSLLSVGGIFARLVYYFPQMTLVRYLCYLPVAVKFFIVLCAGFGVEWMFTRLNKDDIAKTAGKGVFSWAGLMIFMGAILLLMEITIGYLRFRYNGDASVWGSPKMLYKITAVYLIIFAGCWGTMNLKRLLLRWRVGLLAVLVTGGLVIELLVYDYQLFAPRFKKSPRPPIAVQKLVWQQHRVALQTKTGPVAPDEPITEFYRYVRGGMYFMLPPDLDTYRNGLYIDVITDRISDFIECNGQNPRDMLLEMDSIDKLARLSPLCRHSFGADFPKLFLARDIIHAGSDSQALDLVKKNNGSKTRTIIYYPHNPGQNSPPKDFSAREDGLPIITDGIRVTDFGYNRLGVRVENVGNEETYLFYSDAYHPGWHARVNGITSPIAAANYAFKAVRLIPGINQVQFVFFDGIKSFMILFLSVIALVFATGTLVFSGLMFFKIQAVERFLDRNWADTKKRN